MHNVLDNTVDTADLYFYSLLIIIIIIIIIIKQENDYSDVRQLIAVARALY